MLFKVHHITSHLGLQDRNDLELDLKLRMSPNPILSEVSLLAFEHHDWAKRVLKLSFEHVATLELQETMVPNHNLNSVFHLTNSVETEWAPGATVNDIYVRPFTFAVDHARSTAVGDLIEVVDETRNYGVHALYIVASMGFTLVASHVNSTWVLA